MRGQRWGMVLRTGRQGKEIIGSNWEDTGEYKNAFKDAYLKEIMPMLSHYSTVFFGWNSKQNCR